VSGAPLDSSITTARLDDVLGGSTENSRERQHLDDEPGAQRRPRQLEVEDRGAATVRRRPRHLDDVLGGSTDNGGERRHLEDDPVAQRRPRQLDGERRGAATVRRRPRGQLDEVQRSSADPDRIAAILS